MWQSGLIDLNQVSNARMARADSNITLLHFRIVPPDIKVGLLNTYDTLLPHPSFAISIIRSDGADKREYPLQIAINAQYFLHTRELRWYYHRHELFAVAYSGTGINVTAQKIATRSEDGVGEVLYADQRNGD
jgi:hypothetical protein